jgi:hypothetical protein
MNDAVSFLDDRSNLKKFKPCVEVLDYICRKTTTNIEGPGGTGLNPTAIAKEFYKNKYDELDKQFETATERINRGTPEYIKLEKLFSRKKKLGMQVISRKCITLTKLKLICENKNPEMGYDKRNTYYYPTQLGLKVNNIINAKGFPIIDLDDKKSVQDPKLENEYNKEIEYIQHCIKLKEVIRRLMLELPKVKKFGIYNIQIESSELEYHGEQFNIEIEIPELYNDFFNNHLSVDKRLLKKIAVFKHKSKEFWKNKGELFEEMILDLNKYFQLEISESFDIEPLDEMILDWIYYGAFFLVRKKINAFKEYFTDVNFKTRIINIDWGLDLKKGNEDPLRSDVMEYIVGPCPFLRTRIFEDEDFKTHLEKKLGDYMGNMPQRSYYDDLSKNIELFQALFVLRTEIMTILKKELSKPHFPGKCKIIQ